MTHTYDCQQRSVQSLNVAGEFYNGLVCVTAIWILQITFEQCVRSNVSDAIHISYLQLPEACILINKLGEQPELLYTIIEFYGRSFD